MAPRPFLLVLAGVNGAGKSSLGGAMVEAHGLHWFNPDTFARELVGKLGMDAQQASDAAWRHGRELLEAALERRTNHAFETTLGGNTIPGLLTRAAATHDLFMLFVGVSSPEQHIDRVRLRVAHGGHPIPEEKIRERWIHSRSNLVRLLPHLTRLQVFDNSKEAATGDEIPDPLLVLEMRRGQILHPDPDDVAALSQVPAWARAVVQAAIDRSR